MQHGRELGFDGGAHWAVRFRRDQVIYLEGDPSTAVYRLEQGVVRLQVDGADGARHVISFLFPGDVFGVCAGPRICSAEAVTEVVAAHYPLTGVLEAAARSSEAVAELVSHASALARELAHHNQEIRHLAAPERVLRFFEAVAERQSPGGDRVRLAMSRRDVSDYLGLTPETLSRTIRQLRDEGRLSKDGHRSFTICRAAHQWEGGEPHRLRAAGASMRRRRKRAPARGATDCGKPSFSITA